MLTPKMCEAARSLAGLTQKELASNAGLGESTVRNFEAGRSVPQPHNLDAIIAAFEAKGVQFVAAGQIAHVDSVGC